MYMSVVSILKSIDLFFLPIYLFIFFDFFFGGFFSYICQDSINNSLKVDTHDVYVRNVQKRRLTYSYANNINIVVPVSCTISFFRIFNREGTHNTYKL